MHKQRWVVSASLWVALTGAAVLPSTAIALNDTCTNAHVRPMGYQFSQVGNNTTRYYRFLAASGASYHVHSSPVGTNDGAPEFCAVDNWVDATCTTSAGALYGDEDTNDEGSDGDGFVATSSGVHTTAVFNSPEINAFNCETIIQETTLFSPWFFREVANGYDGFVEIRNNHSGTVGGIVVTAFNSSGAATGSTEIAIPGNGTALVRVSDLGAPATGFGSVRIATPQKPGTIVANITTLSGLTGLSFDAPFSRRESPYQ
ncbi:MAG: hypothetical protein H0T80_03030 [Betaproteobacteria bacterium]|nr:hypothetical protein [Betaproteobacteria bacterium]